MLASDTGLSGIWGFGGDYLPRKILQSHFFLPLGEVGTAAVSHFGFAGLFLGAFFEFRHEAEVDVRRHEVLDGRGTQVSHEGTEGSGLRGQGQFSSLGAGGEEQTEPETAGGGFHIAFNAGYLSGEMDAGAHLERKVVVQAFGRVHIGIAVHTAEAKEFGIGKAGHEAESWSDSRRD